MGERLTGTFDAGLTYGAHTPGDAMDARSLAKGMRVRMPSGQVLTVMDVSEPDAKGVVRATLAEESLPDYSL